MKIDGRHEVPTGWRASPWFTLFVLTLTFSVGFIDRQVLNLLVQPIKADFGLSDLQISVLQGAAFSVAYLLMSPLFGRWVDMAGRRNILLGCVVVWSLFTALCGYARGFTSLFAARSGVGAAEAGLTPASWSLLSDTFDDRRLARAMSIYNMGPYLGSGFALLLGGLVLRWAEGWDASGVPLLDGLAPWQLTFVTVSTLGIVCGALLLMIREPKRGSMAATEADAASLTLGQATKIFSDNRRFYWLFYMGMALTIIPIYAFPAWLPALAMRQFGTPISDVGLSYGMITLVCGSAGVLSGPTLGRWLERAGYRDANLRLAVLSTFAVLACCIALFFRTSYQMVLVIGGVISFFYSMPTPLAATALQIVTPNRMRGLATSIYIVIATIMSLGVAPVLVAAFTDHVFKDEARVGDSLAVVCSAAALASMVTLYLCLPAYRRLLTHPIALPRTDETAVPATA